MLRPLDKNLPKVSAYIHLREAKGRRDAATKIMTMLPTLKRLVLIIEDTIYEYRKNLDGVDVTCSLLSTEPSDLDIIPSTGQTFKLDIGDDDHDKSQS